MNDVVLDNWWVYDIFSKESRGCYKISISGFSGAMALLSALMDSKPYITICFAVELLNYSWADDDVAFSFKKRVFFNIRYRWEGRPDGLSMDRRATFLSAYWTVIEYLFMIHWSMFLIRIIITCTHVTRCTFYGASLFALSRDDWVFINVTKTSLSEFPDSGYVFLFRHGTTRNKRSTLLKMSSFMYQMLKAWTSLNFMNNRLSN